MTRWLAIGMTLLLVGCGTFRLPVSTTDEYWLKADAPRPSSRVESLLAYADYVRNLSAAESAKEHERLRAAFAAPSRTDFLRLQYALLLAVSVPPGRDTGRARLLLDPLLKEEGHDADLKRLAAYLHGAIGDHQEAERRYREEQRRAGDLEQKLEALKAIEQRIIQRSVPERKR